jgi:PAS domain S-box-containing protein
LPAGRRRSRTQSSSSGGREPPSVDTAAVLGAALEAVPLAVVALDESGRIRLWSAAARRMFGWTEAEVVARPASVVLGEGADAALAAVAAAPDGASSAHPFDGARKDGEKLHLTVSAAQVRDAAGQVTGLVSVFKETTRSRELEQRFLEAQRLEMTGRLTGGLAHDLKNVLSAIKGYAIVAGDALREGDPARGDIDQILKGTDRGVALTQKLLAFSRNPSAPRMVLDLDAPPPLDAGVAASATAGAGAGAAPPRTASSFAREMSAGGAETRLEVAGARRVERGDQARGEMILVVEDDDLVRVLVARVLRRRGYGVIEAATPLDATERAAGHGGPIHLLLTDIGFPDGGGPDLARRMAAERPEMKVLLMSGYGRAALIERGLLPGPGVLEKPFSPEALIERIRAVLGDGADS